MGIAERPSHAEHDTLSVPHTGDQDQRFLKAMETRNQRFILYGQPGTVRHCCNRCMRVFQDNIGDIIST